MTHALLVDLNEPDATHPLFLATIGAVIGGTVFGRHCSPISDTTIFASASSSCSHLDHVFTQLPYALCVGGVVVLFGYAPVAYGYSPVALLPVATLVLILLLQFGGRPVVTEGTAATAAAPAAHREEGGRRRAGRRQGPGSSGRRTSAGRRRRCEGLSRPAPRDLVAPNVLNLPIARDSRPLVQRSILSGTAGGRSPPTSLDRRRRAGRGVWVV